MTDPSAATIRNAAHQADNQLLIIIFMLRLLPLQLLQQRHCLLDGRKVISTGRALSCSYVKRRPPPSDWKLMRAVPFGLRAKNGDGGNRTHETFPTDSGCGAFNDRAPRACGAQKGRRPMPVVDLNSTPFYGRTASFSRLAPHKYSLDCRPRVYGLDA